jgi:hypothetical protein
MGRAMLLSGVLAFAGLAIYCGSFGSDVDATANDASADRSADANNVATDGDVVDASLEACSAAPPGSTVIVGPTKPTIVAADGVYLYWVSGANVERKLVASDGGVEVVASDGASVTALGLTASHVLYVKGGALIARPRGAPLSTYTSYGSPWLPVLASSDGTTAVGAGSYAVYAVSSPPGGYAKIADIDDTTSAAIAGSKVAFIGTPAGAIAGELRTVVVPGGTPQTIDAGPATATHVALDTTHVFFTDDTGSVRAIELASGKHTVLASAQPKPLGSIALSGEYVYFATANGIRRVAKAGGCVQRITDAPLTSFAIAGTRIYWANGSEALSAPLPSP